MNRIDRERERVRPDTGTTFNRNPTSIVPPTNPLMVFLTESVCESPFGSRSSTLRCAPSKRMLPRGKMTSCMTPGDGRTWLTGRADEDWVRRYCASCHAPAGIRERVRSSQDSLSGFTHHSSGVGWAAVDFLRQIMKSFSQCQAGGVSLNLR